MKYTNEELRALKKKAYNTIRVIEASPLHSWAFKSVKETKKWITAINKMIRINNYSYLYEKCEKQSKKINKSKTK